MPLDGFIVKQFEGKDFVFGNVFRLIIQIQNKQWEAILYHNHPTSEINLISWRIQPGETVCEIQNGEKC